MKIVLLFEKTPKNEVISTIEHLLAYGYDDIIFFAYDARNYFTKNELSYYLTNGIKITTINCIDNESTSQRLLFIKGSLKDTFLIVYSSKIIFCDMDRLFMSHKNESSLATTIVYENKMVACMLESEIFDYTLEYCDFEKEVLKRVGQDLELNQIEE